MKIRKTASCSIRTETPRADTSKFKKKPKMIPPKKAESEPEDNPTVKQGYHRRAWVPRSIAENRIRLINQFRSMTPMVENLEEEKGFKYRL